MNSSRSLANLNNDGLFYKLTEDEIRRLYLLKLLDAPVYILFIVQCHGAPGWRWTFKGEDFCSEWGISKSAFYRAVPKLKTMDKFINWETIKPGVFRVYHKTVQDINNKPKGYKKFLQGSYWKEVRQIVKTRDEYKCQHCSSQQDLEVHHLTYANHGHEREHLEDLITLCNQCHQIEHGK